MGRQHDLPHVGRAPELLARADAVVALKRDLPEVPMCTRHLTAVRHVAGIGPGELFAQPQQLAVVLRGARAIALCPGVRAQRGVRGGEPAEGGGAAVARGERLVHLQGPVVARARAIHVAEVGGGRISLDVPDAQIRGGQFLRELPVRPWLVP